MPLRYHGLGAPATAYEQSHVAVAEQESTAGDDVGVLDH
jgi:hypothetical protein